MGHIVTVYATHSFLYPLYFLSGSFSSVPCSQILFSIRVAAEGTMNKVGQVPPQGHAPCARYLRGIIIFQTPYVMNLIVAPCIS